MVYSELHPILKLLSALYVLFEGTTRDPGCGGLLIAGSVILLTDDVDEATLSSTQTP